MERKETFKDIRNKTVRVGDKVVLLVKSYGYRGLQDAYLNVCTYNGLGQWGYEFGSSKYPFRSKDPVVVRL